GRLRVEGGGSLGWLPIGGDLGLAFAIEVGHARIELRGLAAIRRPVRFDAPSTSGIDISAALGGIDGCGVLQLRAWFGLQLCGGLEAGMVQARPIALVDAPRFVRRPWVALSASVRTLFQVHPRIGLWLAPELVVAFTRIAFIVTGEPDPLARSQWVGGRLRAGVEVRLW